MSIHLTTLSLLRCGLAAGALIAASGIAHGQAIPLPELLVISPSLVPIEASKSGSSVSAMTGEQIRATGFSQLSDVMRTFPGMSVSQLGTRGTLTQFRVRGAEANHLLLVIDGVPANAVGDGEFNFADIPIDDIERVELLRGPQSGLYGANAHSGVLTIVTKSGRGLAKPEFTARAEGGTQNSAEGAMSARGAAGPFYGAITTTYATTNGFNIARNGSPPAPRATARSASPSRARAASTSRRISTSKGSSVISAARPTPTRRTRTSSTPAWWKTARATLRVSTTRWRAPRRR